MARIYADRVMETSTSTGTGNITLAGAATGHRAFSAVCVVGDTFDYAIAAVDGNGTPTGAWETGRGTYSAAGTLTRTTVQASSNSNNAVNFAAGSKLVFLSANASSSIPDTAGKGGQVLRAKSSGDGFEWAPIPGGVPNGGIAGQILTKLSGTDGDYAWANQGIAAPPQILQSGSASANVSATVTLGSAVAAGQIIIATCSGFSAAKTFPAGFVKLPSYSLSNNSVEAAYKIADGTETSITVSASADRCNLSVFVLDKVSNIISTGGGPIGTSWEFSTFAPGGACITIIALETDTTATWTYDASNPPYQVAHFFQNNGGNHNGLTFAVTQTTVQRFKGTVTSAVNAPYAIYQIN